MLFFCYFLFRYCDFDKKLYVYATNNAWILGDRYQNYGFRTTGVSVYVAEEDCKTLDTQEIFYAKCSDNNRLYGRVGTNRNLCGADRREYEHSFFAYVGSMYVIFFHVFVYFT